MAQRAGEFRILVADDLSAEGLAILGEGGRVDVRKGMDESALRDALPPYHALVVRSATQVTARSLERADNLTVIGRAGIGVDNIDVPAATERGIVVMNTPEAGAVTTGEHAIALLLSLARNIPAADASMKAGEWEKSKFTGTELKDKVLGVLGLGRIGRVVAERGKGLAMQVIAHDPWVDADRAPSGVRLVTLDELLAESDFLTVHVPLSDDTRHLLGRERLARMKRGARLVHAARGGIVDEVALCEALRSNHLAGAALDVFEDEPLPADHALRRAPNIVLTPHLGASTREAKHNVSIEMARQVVTCLRRGIVLNGVNVPRIAPSEAAQIEPFLNLTHNLASFLLQVFPGTLQSLRLTLQGELPATAAKPLCIAMLTGALQHRAKIPVTPVNAERIARAEKVRVHTESSALKRDFLHLVRVEALIDEERHFITGTVLGHRHGRMVELDRYLLDAIPEGPLLVTFHRDRPGVIGRIGTLLGCHEINISRLQLAAPQEPADDVALGILNLSSPLPPAALQALRGSQEIVRACSVIC
jgi:D-3-phosphoglycerate dehydrogenase